MRRQRVIVHKWKCAFWHVHWISYPALFFQLSCLVGSVSFCVHCFICIYTLYEHYIDGKPSQRFFPRWHLCPWCISSDAAWSSFKVWTQISLARSDKRSILLINLASFEPYFRGHIWTNFSVLPVTNFGEMKCENTVHIPILVFKLDSCVSLGHPKGTHFSLYNLTWHRDDLSFISLLCLFVDNIYKNHYINNIVEFYKATVKRLSTVPLNILGDELFFIT